MSFRPLLVAGCLLSLAAPASGAGGARPARGKVKKMKVTTVVDKTVDGVVVERKIFLRKGRSKRTGRAVTLEKKAKALESGTIVTDVPAEMPSSLTLKGRLVEKEASYRERKNGAVITLVRPGAHHLSGEQAKRVYSGGRMRKVTRSQRPVKAAVAHVEEQGVAGYRRTGFQLAIWDHPNQRWVRPASGATLTAVGSSTVRIEFEHGGFPLRWDVDRLQILDALEFGSWQGDHFTVEVDSAGWVKVAPTSRPDVSMAITRSELMVFLGDTL